MQRGLLALWAALRSVIPRPCSPSRCCPFVEPNRSLPLAPMLPVTAVLCGNWVHQVHYSLLPARGKASQSRALQRRPLLSGMGRTSCPAPCSLPVHYFLTATVRPGWETPLESKERPRITLSTWVPWTLSFLQLLKNECFPHWCLSPGSSCRPLPERGGLINLS